MSGKVTVKDRIIDAETGQTIESAMRSAGLVPDAFLYLVDGRPVPMDTAITDGMNVQAVKVASGG